MIPPQVGQQADRESTWYMTVWWMVVSPAGGINGSDGIIGGGDLRILRPEHSFAVHYYQADCVPVSGGGAEVGVKGGQSVVV